MLSAKLVSSVLAGVLTLGLTGAAAFAAFPLLPQDSGGLAQLLDARSFTSPVAAVDPQTAGATTATHPERQGDKGLFVALERILDHLVSNGTITAAQKEAILKAVREADRRHDEQRPAHKIAADLMRLSGEYLGLSKEQLGEALRSGKSLGQIADATPGKSKAGLVAFLTEKVNAHIAEALASGRITEPEAVRLREAWAEKIAKFVDQTFTRKPGEDEKRRNPAMNVKHFVADATRVAADYLGMERSDLNKELASGKSLGQIADATPGKSKSGLAAALVNAANAKVDEAVAKGQLATEQATKIKAAVAEMVAKIVDEVRGKKDQTRGKKDGKKDRSDREKKTAAGTGEKKTG